MNGATGADQPDEAADEDRLAAVAVEEALDLLQPLLGDLDRGPWRSRNSRPSRRPRKKLVMSPATAQTQTIAISATMSISPWPATTPPTSIAVSPGATSPTNAPVSRKASTPTSR